MTQLYRIQKTMTATLLVRCTDEQQARNCADAIVADLVSEGLPQGITIAEVEDFSADYNPDQDLEVSEEETIVHMGGEANGYLTGDGIAIKIEAQE